MGRRRFHLTLLAFGVAAAQVLFVQFGSCLSADEQEHRMISLGLKLFLPFLGADEDLAAKTAPDGNLPVVVVYMSDVRQATEMAQRLAQTETLKGIPLKIITQSLDDLLESPAPYPAGVFLAERFGFDLPNLAHWGIEHRVLTFSPFSGDVEGGILGGVLVTERILPYVNMQTLKRSGIHLKPFFLKIAARYE